MFKVNDRNTRTECEICSKLTKKTPEQRHWHSSVSIVNFEQVIAGWDLADISKLMVSFVFFPVFGDNFMFHISRLNLVSRVKARHRL